jgi:hypothetical protein
LKPVNGKFFGCRVLRVLQLTLRSSRLSNWALESEPPTFCDSERPLSFVSSFSFQETDR